MRTIPVARDEVRIIEASFAIGTLPADACRKSSSGYEPIEALFRPLVAELRQEREAYFSSAQYARIAEQVANMVCESAATVRPAPAPILFWAARDVPMLWPRVFQHARA